MKFYYSILFILIALLFAQEQTFKLKDGTKIVGEIVEETETSLSVLTKFGLHTHPKWKPYLKYKPLSGDVTLEEMVTWMRQEEEDVCNMCPAYDDTREKVIDKDVFGERRYS